MCPNPKLHSSLDSFGLNLNPLLHFSSGSILDFFGLSAKDLPTLRLVNLADEMAKYKPDATEINADNIKTFVKSFLDGSLKVSGVAFPLLAAHPLLLTPFSLCFLLLFFSPVFLSFLSLMAAPPHDSGHTGGLGQEPC